MGFLLGSRHKSAQSTGSVIAAYSLGKLGVGQGLDGLTVGPVCVEGKKAEWGLAFGGTAGDLRHHQLGSQTWAPGPSSAAYQLCDFKQSTVCLSEASPSHFMIHR